MLDSNVREAESMLKRDRSNADCALRMPVKHQTAIRQGTEAYQEVHKSQLSARAVAGAIVLVPNTTYRARDKKTLTSLGDGIDLHQHSATRARDVCPCALHDRQNCRALPTNGLGVRRAALRRVSCLSAALRTRRCPRPRNPCSTDTQRKGVRVSL
jgi:hypothetical protein